MTEMEQEKRVSLNADVMIRKALDLRIKNNVLIAEFMGYENVGTLNNPMYDYYDNYFKDGCKSVNDLCYHKSWDWLMPVIDKCYQEHMSKHIADAVMTCDIDKVYKVVVEFINQLNK